MTSRAHWLAALGTTLMVVALGPACSCSSKTTMADLPSAGEDAGVERADGAVERADGAVDVDESPHAPDASHTLADGSIDSGTDASVVPETDSGAPDSAASDDDAGVVATPELPMCSTLEDGSLVWARTLGGSGTGVPTGSVLVPRVGATPEGHALIAGLFTGTVDFDPADDESATLSTGDPLQAEGFLARYETDGSLAWVTHLRGQVGVNDVSVHDDRSCVVTGRFTGSVTFAPGSPEERTLSGRDNSALHAFIARYAADGALMWATDIGGEGTGEAQAIGVAVLDDGSLALTGGFNDTVIFGAGEPNETRLQGVNPYESDAFIAKYAGDGSLIWAKAVETPTDNNSRAAGESVAALADGAFAVVGVFRGVAVLGAGEPNETALTGEGGFVAHYDGDGRLRWARRAEGTLPYDTATLTDGATVVVGTFNQSATFAPGEPEETSFAGRGGDDAFGAAYTADGALKWVRQLGGADWDRASSVTTRSDGIAIVVGFVRPPAVFDSTGTAVTPAGYEYSDDVFIAAYAQDGTLEWSRAVGGPAGDQGGAVAVAANGTTWVTGEINRSVADYDATFGAGEPNETVITGTTASFVARYVSCHP